MDSKKLDSWEFIRLEEQQGGDWMGDRERRGLGRLGWAGVLERVVRLAACAGYVVIVADFVHIGVYRGGTHFIAPVALISKYV